MDQSSSLPGLKFDPRFERKEGRLNNTPQLAPLEEARGQNIGAGRDLAQGGRNIPPARPEAQNIQSYYVSRDGTIYVDGRPGQNAQFYVESSARPGNYDLVAALPVNAQGLVRFPSTGAELGMNFERYGREDAGGFDARQNETVGQGDHYLRPVAAAALFGLTKELSDRGITMSYGDMSSSNGSDPWEHGQNHHAGHGHHGNRSGENADFRYVDRNGRAFQDAQATTDPRFNAENNQLIYDTARNFGFTQNFQGRGSNLPDVTVAQGHNDHGHLGYEHNPDRIRIGRPPAPVRAPLGPHR
jgi:hypothetical protein